jgi:hypothetical protein
MRTAISANVSVPFLSPKDSQASHTGTRSYRAKKEVAGFCWTAEPGS